MPHDRSCKIMALLTPDEAWLLPEMAETGPIRPENPEFLLIVAHRSTTRDSVPAALLFSARCH